MNECMDEDPCHASANCSNAYGTFFCACISGFTGDGFDCIGM